jgi:general secretion pathway protein D
MKKLFFILVIFISSSQIFAQRDLEKTLSQVVNPEELVTISENLSFDQAIAILSKVSERTNGKKIVATFSSSQPIGVEIEKLPYKKALQIIVQYNGYVYDEGEDVIVVKRKESSGEEKKTEGEQVDINTREVKISCVFFDADLGKMRQLGINWKFLLSNNAKSIGTELHTFTDQSELSTTTSTTVTPENKLNLSGSTTINAGDFVGDATALFRAFETENLGEIIASPNITVRNNSKGRIQIGSDFSIKTRDFSGNIIDKFFSTGSIIEVTPHIYNQDGIDYIMLDLLVDRSSAIPSEISTEIKRTNATTQVLMLNNEETIIGGLYINDEQTERTGIPFLKDLPWWVFGIRYLTGSDQVTITKKEVVILIKVELLPTLKERVNIVGKEEDKIQNQLDNYKKEIELYKSKSSTIEKGK